MDFGKIIRDLTDDDRIIQFADFAFAGLSDGELPDFESLDLMDVAKLVPNLFVHDYRAGIEQGLLIKFSGSELDTHYGQNIQGKYFQDTYSGEDKERYIELHLEAIRRRRPFFVRRTIAYGDDDHEDKYRLSTALYVPCSSDQVTINYAIGIVLFVINEQSVEPTYKILGD